MDVQFSCSLSRQIFVSSEDSNFYEIVCTYEDDTCMYFSTFLKELIFAGFGRLHFVNKGCFCITWWSLQWFLWVRHTCFIAVCCLLSPAVQVTFNRLWTLYSTVLSAFSRHTKVSLLLSARTHCNLMGSSLGCREHRSASEWSLESVLRLLLSVLGSLSSEK